METPAEFDSPDEFEVMSIGEMRRKYYSSGESPPPIKLDKERVPEALRKLIPLAEKWGISDDILRLDALESASAEEVAVLRNAFAENEDLLEMWLTGPEADGPTLSPEYIAFSAMQMAANGC